MCAFTRVHVRSFNGCCDTLSPSGPFKDSEGLTTAAASVAAQPIHEYSNGPGLANGVAARAGGAATGSGSSLTGAAHANAVGGVVAGAAAQPQASTSQAAAPLRPTPIPPLRDMVMSQASVCRGWHSDGSRRMSRECPELHGGVTCSSGRSKLVVVADCLFNIKSFPFAPAVFSGKEFDAECFLPTGA